MKTHNAVMYHCLNCGNVVHSEQKVRAPQCCDHEMVLAAAETIYDREDTVPKQQPGVHCVVAPPIEVHR